MNAGDRLVCALLTEMPIHELFSNWPLHITVVPWFRSQQSTESLIAGLGKSLTAMERFKVRAGESGVKFGHQKGKLATLIQLPSPLIGIEQQVRSFLRTQQAWIVDESTKQKREYRPHVTDQGSQAMHAGESFTIDRLYIIEQMGGYKQVAGEVF